MSDEAHFRRLETMYQAAPINEFFRSKIAIGHGTARIELEMDPKYHHSAGAAHGAVYFKALDDAGFFACNSLVDDVFMLTTGFNIHLTRPIQGGKMVAEGRWLHGHRRVFLAEAALYNQDGEEIARGSGNFMRSRIPLADIDSYRNAVAV